MSLRPRKDQQPGLAAYHSLLTRHKEGLEARLLEIVRQLPGFSEALGNMSATALAERQALSDQLLEEALVQGEWDGYFSDLQGQGRMYARMGVPFASWFAVITAYRTAMLPKIQEEAADHAEFARLVDAMDQVNEIALATIGTAYLEAKEEIIQEQQQSILELSTPVLQVRDGLLILPVVGLVDTRRARQLTENLLTAIRQQRAGVAIMDVTGVPLVDSRVAQHFLQTAQAARLMGAEVLITGISAEIAQTMVSIGADLRGVRTLGNLQAGLEAAERLLAGD